MTSKEATARLQINQMLEESGRRLLDDEHGPATVVVESNVTMKSLGDDFEKTDHGFIDYLLVDNNGFPLCVLEAKSSDKDPLIGKEQARSYAQGKNVRFIILSNGHKHYFRDRESGNPQIISHFPSMDQMLSQQEESDEHTIADLIQMRVEDDDLVKLKKPNYLDDIDYQNTDTRGAYCRTYGLRFFRKYQLDAIHAIQRAIKNGKQRFLFEMATGTGKTLTSAGIINLFLKSGVAKRVLFLVDRIELENQAWKSFNDALGMDYSVSIFKKNRDTRKQSQIVVSTVQTFAANQKYKDIFSPYDFGLIISDEAHRSISGSYRSVFEYFIGYKLGLTATPKDYLKNFDDRAVNDPREVERRELLDTYTIFGCESGEPTFRYSLTDGVKDPDGPFLVNPITLDCRTEITTQLLSDKGYVVNTVDDEGEEVEQIFGARQFERTFFSEETNIAMMQAFMKEALRDPISGEIGKTIMFAVSRRHASKLTQILNEMAHQLFPGKYNSDFAVQITSDIANAQQFTINFSNNKLNGETKRLTDYPSSKTRVCVTVGMMTTGYDCQDLLNIALCRPIFSPTDFVQIKGRGTRLYDFNYEDQHISKKDLHFKLFDYFANCEYFEEQYDYDQVLKLPKIGFSDSVDGDDEITSDELIKKVRGSFENMDDDFIVSMNEQLIGDEGMRIDRELYAQKFEKSIQDQFAIDEKLQELANSFDESGLEQYAKEFMLNKPDDYFTVTKLNDSYNFERILGLGEIMLKALGLIKRFKTKREIVNEARDEFVHSHEGDCVDNPAVRQIFTNYCLSSKFKNALDVGNMGYFTAMNFMPLLTAAGKDCINLIRDHVSIEDPKLLQLSQK